MGPPGGGSSSYLAYPYITKQTLLLFATWYYNLSVLHQNGKEWVFR